MTETEKRVAHLQLIQEPISRMSSISSIFKGFSATILAGLAAATIADISLKALIIGVLPILNFACMDIYYLKLERKLRYRYNQVRENKISVDFKIDTNFTKEEIKAAKASIWQCLKSPSVWLFYIPIILCAGVLVFFKWKGSI